MVKTAQTFTLKSSDIGGQFTETQFANENFGGSGKNISPELHWENAPKETKSFAVAMHDLDAPTGGSGLWHWITYNIPPSATSLPTDAGNLSANNLPDGAIGGLNDVGVKGYVGPCPPAGELHRYIITVHALKDTITVNENASAALIGFMLSMNTLAKASLLVYGKNSY
ncbi:YbhB/YbcL family Raf kinase inhibitor-like protein [Chitinophaga sp. 212800010-3]|uniref:YbhB/YbcL family Raf kinase inhibitor-like protein n=1 Tax=unclassified Chitinophaga TaxID=2619133 RepID=UPI002DE58906|nr:YbhB/YbcL family Raf kinase inhibitor-like protein [Chitinophaga sp. 212800010-3]